MHIKKIHIEKFRGFHDVSFDLGENITVIAGQNGTQKTTLLGIISQPFTITEKINPLYGEKPLSGGNYKSAFGEKFKLSENFDKPKEHEWTLYPTNQEESEFTVESIERKDGRLRFWKKGDRSKGSGYIQLPVIYLSLSRLFPIGEDADIDSSSDISLTKAEFIFYKRWHDKILCIPDVKIEQVDYLASKQKNTLGVSTSFYDWKMNSAGQDNIGKIILSILSFKRLQEKYGNEYKGGILVIDELDATLYPAAQLKLLEALRKFSSEYKIQVIFTTHSLTILQRVCEWQENPHFKKQIRIVYLSKFDNAIRAIVNISFLEIKDKLSVTLSGRKQMVQKIPVFTEDEEGQIFMKAVLKRKSSNLTFVKCNFGYSNLIELAKRKVPGFKYYQSIIVLDGDVKKDTRSVKSLSEMKHFLLLPGNKSIERLLADFLYNLSDDSSIWDEIYGGYTKQFAFSEIDYEEIQKDRENAKKWFKGQKEYWGRGCSRMINPWIKENKEEVDKFIGQCEDLMQTYNQRLI